MARPRKTKPGRKGSKKAAPSNPERLTFRQRMFIDAYLGEANGNATEAARIAGYAHPNVQAAQTLAKLSIRAAIDARLAEAAMSANEVLSRLTSMGKASVADFVSVNPDGSYRLDLEKGRAAGKLHLVKALRPTKFGLAIELHDAQSALEKLGKYHGLWQEKTPAQPASDQADDMAIQGDDIPDDDARPEPREAS